MLKHITSILARARKQANGRGRTSHEEREKSDGVTQAPPGGGAKSGEEGAMDECTYPQARTTAQPQPDGEGECETGYDGAKGEPSAIEQGPSACPPAPHGVKANDPDCDTGAINCKGDRGIRNTVDRKRTKDVRHAMRRAMKVGRDIRRKLHVPTEPRAIHRWLHVFTKTHAIRREPRVFTKYTPRGAGTMYDAEDLHTATDIARPQHEEYVNWLFGIDTEEAGAGTMDGALRIHFKTHTAFKGSIRDLYGRRYDVIGREPAPGVGAAQAGYPDTDADVSTPDASTDGDAPADAAQAPGADTAQEDPAV